MCVYIYKPSEGDGDVVGPLHVMLCYMYYICVYIYMYI